MKASSTFYDKTNILVKTIQKLSGTKSYEQIQEIVKVAARKISDSDGATFVLKENGCCNYVDEDAISPLWKGKCFPLETRISGWVMLNHKPAIIDDIYKDNRIPAEAYKSTFVKSLVMVPIRRFNPIGAIGIYWSDKNKASSFDLTILQSLADSTSIAMENVKNLSLLNDTVSELKKENKQKAKALKELQKAKQVIQKEELKFRGIFEYSNIGVAIINPNGDIIDLNKEFTEITGYSKRELQQMNFADFTYPDDLNKELDLFKKLNNNDINNYRIRKRYVHKTGTIIWVDIAVSCLRNKNNEIEMFFGMVMDITEQKKSEEQFRNTLDDMLEGCQIIGFDWKYLFINGAAELHNRRPKEELLGKKYMDMWPGIEETNVFKLIEDCLLNRNSHKFENKFQFPDGSLGWFEISIEPITNGVLIFSNNITNQKQAQLALDNSLKRLKEAQHIAKIGDFKWDVETGALSWSEAMYNLLGYNTDERFEYKVVNKNIHHPEDEAEVNKWFKESIASGESVLRPKEYRVIKKGGETIYVRTQGQIIRDNNGKITIFGTAQDITVQKHSEINQKMTNEILDVLNNTEDSEKMAVAVIDTITKFTGLNAVAIRLKDGDDYPYYHTKGFKESFVIAERYLIERDELGNIKKDENGKPILECMCGEIVNGKTDPTKSFFSKGGSFYTNDSSILSGKDHHVFSCDRFKKANYNSVALIPIKSGAEIIGILQLNHHNKARFNDDNIMFFEEIASNIGIAITRNNAKEELKKNKKLLEETGKIAKVGGWEYHIGKDLWTWTNAVADIHEEDYNTHHNQQDIYAYFQGKYRNLLIESVHKAIEKKEPFDIELKLATRKGNYKWIRKIGIPLIKNGKVVKLTGSMQDITQKAKQNILIASRLRLIDYSRNHNVDELLRKFLDEAEMLTDSQVGFYHFVDQDQETLRLQAWSSNTVNHMCKAEGSGLHYNISQGGVWCDAVHQRKSVIHSNYKELPHRKGLPQGHAPVVREMVVPVFRENKIVAILGVGNKQTDYDKTDQELVENLADFAWEILERIKAEETLQENEVKYRNLFMGSPDAIFINLDDKIILANKALVTLMKLKNYNDLLGKTPYDVFHPNCHEEVRERIRNVRELKRKIPSYEEQIIDSKGEIIDVEVHRSVFKIGDKIAIHVILRDITLKKLNELELENYRKNLEELVKQRSLALFQSEVKYRGLFENVKDGIIHTNLEGVVLECNPEFSDMLGYDRDEIVGLKPSDIWRGSRDELQRNKIKNEIMKRGYSEEFVQEFIRKDGKNISVSIRAWIEKDNNQQANGMWALVRDVTKRKEHEDAIIKLNHELESKQIKLEYANHELDAFAYSVSHDLRAPLRAISGFTEILVEEYGANLDTEAQRICGVIDDNATKMGNLIDDLLSFSRLGRSEIQYSKIEMDNMATSIYYEATTPELRKRTKFSVHKIPVVSADSKMMRQVWMNLISNALKYSSKEEIITIDVSAVENNDNIVYSIKDNGVGFDMKYKEKLFGVFQRLHKPTDFEGTGVGLALVQRIIKRHGGDVWGESVVGQGATFFFSIPKNTMN